MRKASKKTVEIRPQDSDIKFIDLRVDFAFKRVFGTPGNEELLKMLVDSILPELHIKTLSLGNHGLQHE